MEGINHSCRERLSWSDGGGSKRDKNVLPPFWITRNFALGRPTFTLQHASSASLSFSLSLVLSFLSYPSFATLCAHRQHSIIRPCQLQPLRLTTEEFDVSGSPYVPLALADSKCVSSVGERGNISEKEEHFRSTMATTRRNNPVRASFIFYRALICFPVICCSVPPSFFSRAERCTNICSSQSPGIIWNKHSRRIINPSNIFLAANFTQNRDSTSRYLPPRGFSWQSSFYTQD